MADFTYTALRSLKSGHSSGTEYTITIDLQKLDDEQPSAVKIEHVSIGGNVVTQLNRIERYADIVTDYIQTAGGTPDVDDFTEFFNSVAGGETFTFDDGTAQSAILDGKVTRTRIGLFFNYAFRMRLL